MTANEISALSPNGEYLVKKRKHLDISVEPVSPTLTTRDVTQHILVSVLNLSVT